MQKCFSDCCEFIERERQRLASIEFWNLFITTTYIYALIKFAEKSLHSKVISNEFPSVNQINKGKLMLNGMYLRMLRLSIRCDLA